MGSIRVERIGDAPLVDARTDPRLDGNVTGPSLVRAPPWVDAPMARYYLYFAHHEGDRIRLATANVLTGPWTLHVPGALGLAESRFPTTRPRDEDLDPRVRAAVTAGADGTYPHIASPDAHVDADSRTVRLYYHGRHVDGTQRTRVALSDDGVRFRPRAELLGPPYFRVFRFRDVWYALAMPGVVLRSYDGLTDFERGPTLFDPNMRHSAVLVRGDVLHVFWTQVGDAPERILHSTVDLSRPWTDWREGPATEVMRPEPAWEGARLPAAPSKRGSLMTAANQLRDPALYVEDGRVFLLYCGAAEQAIGLAEVFGIDA